MEDKEKIFGIGLNKTGTTSLGKALEILGFKNHVSWDFSLTRSWLEGDRKELYKVADCNNNFEDWPWPLTFEEMFYRYPNSKFILTTRKSSEIWYKSQCKHMKNALNPGDFNELIFGYYSPIGNKNEFISQYEEHNKNVIDFFNKNNPNRLLSVCWENGDGWKEVSEFLDLPLPDVEFPFLNQSPEINVLKRVLKRIFSSKLNGYG